MVSGRLVGQHPPSVGGRTVPVGDGLPVQLALPRAQRDMSDTPLCVAPAQERRLIGSYCC
jgi:hypothetical protein